MRNLIQMALLIGVLVARSFSQQASDRFIQPPSLPEIIPPGFLADRDPVLVDPQHFRVNLQNERVRVVHLTMNAGEATRMHETPELLAVCIKECHVRLTRPDGKIQDLHMQAGVILNGTLTRLGQFSDLKSVGADAKPEYHAASASTASAPL